MTFRFPSAFVSHGSPTLIRDDCPVRTFLQNYGEALGRPTAIVVVSAHWETDPIRVSHSAAPPTIHDFYGFPPELYELTYPAPGDPVLAGRIVDLLHRHGFAAETDDQRGLDHGAWVPLKLMYPRADVPVLQVSLPAGHSTDHALKLGRALMPLRDEGALILGSGNVTHNLSEFRGAALDSPPPGWVTAFADWVEDAVALDDRQGLVNYRNVAPAAVENHPSEEHYTPLLVALGAGGAGQAVHRSYTYAVLGMDAYAFD